MKGNVRETVIENWYLIMILAIVDYLKIRKRAHTTTVISNEAIRDILILISNGGMRNLRKLNLIDFSWVQFPEVSHSAASFQKYLAQNGSIRNDGKLKVNSEMQLARNGN